MIDANQAKAITNNLFVECDFEDVLMPVIHAMICEAAEQLGIYCLEIRSDIKELKHVVSLIEKRPVTKQYVTPPAFSKDRFVVEHLIVRLRGLGFVCNLIERADKDCYLISVKWN